MHQAEQSSLSSDLVQPAQREPIQPLVVPEIAEHRLHGPDTLAVSPSSLRAVDATFHGLHCIARPVGVLLEDGNLPNRRSLRMSQAEIPELAGHAAAPGADVPLIDPAVDRAPVATAIQLLPTGTDAVVFATGHREVLRPVQP